MTFDATGLPGSLTIDEETGVISGTIDSNAYLYSPFSVTITATNDDANVSNYIEFDWSVGFLVLRDPGDQWNLSGIVSEPASITRENSNIYRVLAP